MQIGTYINIYFFENILRILYFRKLLIVEEKILLRHRKDTVSVQIYCSNDLSSQRRKKFLNLFHIFFNESLYTNTQKIRYAYFHNDLDEFQLEDVDPIIEKLYPSVDQRPVYYSAQVYQSGNEVDIQLKHYGKSGLLDKSNQFQEPPSNGPVLPWSPISPGSIISKFSSDNVDRKPVEMANQGRLRKESSGSLSGKVVSSEEFESLLSSKSKDKYACPLKGASKEKFESFRRQPPSKNSRSSDQDNLPTTPAIYKSAIFEKSMKNLFENQLGEYIPKEYSRASRNGNASSTYSWNSEIKVILDSVSEQSIDEDSVQ